MNEIGGGKGATFALPEAFPTPEGVKVFHPEVIQKGDCKRRDRPTQIEGATLGSPARSYAAVGFNALLGGPGKFTGTQASGHEFAATGAASQFSGRGSVCLLGTAEISDN